MPLTLTLICTGIVAVAAGVILAIYINQRNQPQAISYEPKYEFNLVKERNENQSNKTSKICTICHLICQKQNEKELSCHHVFHNQCLNSWKNNKNNDNRLCPNCKEPAKTK